MVKMNLCGLSADEIFGIIEPSGFTARHSVKIANSIYKKRISDILQFDKIPKKLKEELTNIAVSGINLPLASAVSKDYSVKYLFRTDKGKEFETVFIPEKKRNTVCVSTQSGCRMGCSFCATAKYGYKGNLEAGEIINQIISIPQAEKVTHVVFMGMGEPMDNLENVLKACSIITSEWGLALSSKNITISTVGIMPGVEQFLQRSEYNLALSLYSPFAAERRMAVPAEIKYPARNIIEMMKGFPAKKKRRLSVAYIMLKDINDTDLHLEELISALANSEIRVNLLSYHSVLNDKYCSSSEERIKYFKHNLIISGISASIRKSRGSDISAACGLLAATR
jgi:23S rRNA (adenine2503-C2)-methyltransferase